MDQNDVHNEQEVPQENNQEVASEPDYQSMESLLAQEDLSLDLPTRGEVREGIIARISETEILVSIGAKSEGVIPIRELEQLDEEEQARVKVGTEIPVYVVSPESRQGTLLLSYTRALEEEDWDKAEEYKKKDEPYEGVVDGYNKGGLIVRMGRLRAFVPASQVSISRRMSYSGDSPEQRWGGMAGEPIVGRVIEVDRQRRRLILSEKAAYQEARETLKERLLEELKEGEIRTGRVTSLAEFGAFVNINGADGLVHLSEISWDRIDDPSELLKVGQEVKVKVISVDKDRKRIGLSLRQLEDDPWHDLIESYKVGQLVVGTITRLTKFGAFARIDEELEGLIHISELSEQRIEHPKEVVKESDEVTLRIIKIDEKRRRIGLSLRKVDSGAFKDVDWEMTLAEIDEMAEGDIEEEDAELPADFAPAEAQETAMETGSEEQQDEGDEETTEMAESEEEMMAEAEVEEAPEMSEDEEEEAAEEEAGEASAEEEMMAEAEVEEAPEMSEAEEEEAAEEEMAEEAESGVEAEGEEAAEMSGEGEAEANEDETESEPDQAS